MHAHAFPKVQGGMLLDVLRAQPPTNGLQQRTWLCPLVCPDVPDNWRGQIACGLCCRSPPGPWGPGLRAADAHDRRGSVGSEPDQLGRWDQNGRRKPVMAPFGTWKTREKREEIGSKPNDKVCHDCSACISTTYVQIRVAISKNVLI